MDLKIWRIVRCRFQGQADCLRDAPALKTTTEEINRLRPVSIQASMESPILPPEKRACNPSPTLVFIIVGVIAGAFVMFLLLGPQ